MREVRLGISLASLQATPAASTMTAKAMLAPREDAFLADEEPTEPATRRGGQHLSRREQLLNDRRLTLKAKLDLQARLEAANLGSLLFTHRLPASATSKKNHVKAQTVSSRSGAVTAREQYPSGDQNAKKPAARPLSARPATNLVLLDTKKRRPRTSLPRAQAIDHECADSSLVPAHGPQDKDDQTAHGKAPTPKLRLWAMEQASIDRVASERNKTSSRRNSMLEMHDEAPRNAVDSKRLEDREQKLLRCGVTFKCQPDFLWKDKFKATALELQQVVEIERKYNERMSSYYGKQITKARVQLNTPRDEPNRSRVLNSKGVNQISRPVNKQEAK